jgi:hypothetical protein
MRRGFNALTAVFLITLMICSVAVPQFTNYEQESGTLVDGA